ncbi:hypothetical protein pEaSNUABM40_00324 [Erwinia phage pEa_SNUABM_40]|uniref:Uncharacterized protein n=1 Tax=Erwinia phage pEa_SNUABM_3 TaxID=2869552 RepID=A0AAE7XHR5_9CAUD|nr:hypothetical protein MPK68_gp322 [Erwinia phage pEa_SNUABM_3]QZE56856.1 hypothetical protein pEaSNUABM20_00320 [Erwinia phage pEa_SNUABM_20]QZE58540.1 hypothetical protein pEaSNUABM40_00324 [Erwinia phage pEa_SNUABM_40]UAW53101.1 hypothetical protein pEaSNUABM23_00319 [Erwinia phage pEa_SNUABM_23]UIW10996.1 hypothetical protein pEaSNUABM23_00319 [Erwinia phage pEa_SNUABM_31]QZE56519.1 hypothetical protein pEaSNUABM3_00322 [Erwinia phage pEa_SNUABM_3]
MTNNEIILTGVFAQLYSRLTTAAVLETYVYYSDLAPVVFGVQLSTVSNSQYNALWELVAKTMRVDIAAGRPPLAALYVSRATDEKTPSKKFFKEYYKLTGVHLSETDWRALVEHVWKSYAPDLREPS